MNSLRVSDTGTVHDTADPDAIAAITEAKKHDHESRILELAARARAMESELNDRTTSPLLERLALGGLESKTKSRR